MAVCPRCGRDTPDTSRFCPSCGATLSQPPPHEVRKAVTILFADVIESTPLGERLDPEALRRILSRYFERMQAIVERHEGRVEKFIGDAIMAVFGIPVAHEDDALRALRAAVEMRESLSELNVEIEQDHGVRLEVRMGVNTGEVVASDHPSRQALVTGDAVNVAARLEQAAAPGQILVGHETQRLVRAAVRAGGPQYLDVKGKSKPVIAFALETVIPYVSVPARRLDVPLVGRDDELSILLAALERVITERSCQLFTVLGPAGIGKSRLAAELMSVAGDRASVLVGHALPYGEGITYWPVIEALRQAAGIRADDVTVPALERLVGLAGGDEEEAHAAATRVAELVGAGEASVTSWETFWALRRVFEGIARRRPLVLVLEDLHWAEPTMLDFLEYVADWSRGAPFLLLCLVRPELLDERPSWSRRMHAQNFVLLEPLQKQAADKLIDTLLAGAPLVDAARARIADAAEGNPLFLEQMLAMVAEEDRATNELAVPPTIRALLTARLDRLSENERAVLERAAIMGRVFSWEAVRELWPEADSSVIGEQLMTLARKELVTQESDATSSEHRFRFKHALIREAAYAAMPKEMRADLHERFADWLEGRSAEYDEIVGYHLEQAFRCHTDLGRVDDTGLAERAADRLASAGRRAFARGDMPTASMLLGRAATLYSDQRGDRLQLLPLLGAALRETGELGPADVILTEAASLAKAAGDQRVESLAQIERASLRDYTDSSSSLDEVRRVAEHGLVVFEQLGDDEGLAHASSLLAEVHWSRARFGEMEEVLKHALTHAERAGDERQRAFLLNGLARAAFLGPMPVDAALRRCAEIMAQARGDPVLVATLLPPIAGLHALNGDFEEARSLYLTARARFEEFGLRTALGALPLYSGPIELLAGDAIAAERELRGGCDVLEIIGDRSRLSTALAFLAQALYAQGRSDDAETAALDATAAATPHDSYTHVVGLGTRALVLAGAGNYADADQLGRKGIDLAGATDSTNLVGDAFLVLSEVSAAAGSYPEAARHAVTALRRYREKGNRVSSIRAEELACLDPDGPRA
jgi:class 3 adenylate cyclase/tetratricopeptide (TPR) repeat protein